MVKLSLEWPSFEDDSHPTLRLGGRRAPIAQARKGKIIASSLGLNFRKLYPDNEAINNF
jgi:hypothetical protein